MSTIDLMQTTKKIGRVILECLLTIAAKRKLYYKLGFCHHGISHQMEIIVEKLFLVLEIHLGSARFDF